jgi:hypothetical protein
LVNARRETAAAVEGVADAVEVGVLALEDPLAIVAAVETGLVTGSELAVVVTPDCVPVVVPVPEAVADGEEAELGAAPTEKEELIARTELMLSIATNVTV